MELFFFDIETAGAYSDYLNFKLNDIKGSELFENKFNKMNWQDKYSSINEAYLDNSGIISTYGIIVCISYGFIKNDGEYLIKSIYGEEIDIINQFNDVLKKVETKSFNLSGYRIFHFDIPWFLHKCHKYNITPAKIISTYNIKPWEMRITDLSEDWKGKFAWSYSFDEMVYELGLQSPKEKMSGDKVHEKYWNGNILEIVEYCEADVRACIEASKKIYN
jgi:predicted PolB exonuclease-like 3'-5' exonuclease